MLHPWQEGRGDKVRINKSNKGGEGQASGRWMGGCCPAELGTVETLPKP